MGADMGDEFPDGNLLPDVLLRPACAPDFPSNFPRKAAGSLMHCALAALLDEDPEGCFCVAEGSQGQEGHLHPRAEERAAAGHHADGSSHGRYAGRIGVRDSRHGVAAGECHFHAGHSADSRVRAADCTVHQRRQVRWTRWRFSGRWMRRKAKAAWSSCRKERT